MSPSRPAKDDRGSEITSRRALIQVGPSRRNVHIGRHRVSRPALGKPAIVHPCFGAHLQSRPGSVLRAPNHDTAQNHYIRPRTTGNFQIPDLLAQRVAVEAQHRRGLDLIAAGGRQRQPDQRPLHLRDDLVVDVGDAHAVIVRGQELLDVALHRARQGFRAIALRRRRRRSGGGRRIGEFGLDHLGTDDFVRTQRRQPPHQVFQLAHIARPAMLLQPVNRPLVEALGRQPVFTSAFQEMPGQQRRCPRRARAAAAGGSAPHSSDKTNLLEIGLAGWQCANRDGSRR